MAENRGHITLTASPAAPSGDSANSTKIFAYVFLSAFLLRACWIFSSRHSLFFSVPQNDHEAYFAWGTMLAVGIEPPVDLTAQQPAYAYLLAACVHILPDALTGIRMLHAIIGSMSCALVYQGTARLFGGASGVVAAVMFGGTLPVIMCDTTWSKESLALGLLCAGIFGLSTGSRSGRIGGILLLLIVPLMRDIFALPAAVACAAAGLMSRRRGEGIAFALAVLLMLPLGSMFHAHVRKGVPQPQGPGVSMYMGLHPDASLTYIPPAGVRSARVFLFQDFDSVSMSRFGKKTAYADRAWGEAAIRYVAENPVRVARLLLLRLGGVFWGGPFDDNYPSGIFRKMLFPGDYLVPAWALFSLGIGGAWIFFRSGRHRSTFWSLAALLAACIAPLLVYGIFDRLRLPVFAVMGVFSAAGIKLLPTVSRADMIAYGVAVSIAVNPMITAIQAPLYQRATEMGEYNYQKLGEETP